MNSVVRQLLEQNTDVVMVDTGDSYEGICGYFGGTYISYSKEKPISMNPFKVENPGSDDPLDQVELTPEAKISLTPLPKIKMTPVDVMSAGDFICIFGFRFGRRGIKPKKHEHKIKKHSLMSRIMDGHKMHQ